LSDVTCDATMVQSNSLDGMSVKGTYSSALISWNMSHVILDEFILLNRRQVEAFEDNHASRTGDSSEKLVQKSLDLACVF